MTVYLTEKAWGSARINSDGKLKTWRRAKDASQKIRWRKSKRRKAISRAQARGFNRP